MQASPELLSTGIALLSAVGGALGGGVASVLFIQSQVARVVDPLAKEFRDFKDNWPDQLNGRYTHKETADLRFRQLEARVRRLEGGSE